MSLRGYMGALRRYWWVIAAVVGLATAGAYVLSSLQPAKYRAVATMVYSGAFTDTYSLALELASVNATVTSSSLNPDVMGILHRGLPPRNAFTVSADPVQVAAGGNAVGTTELTRVVAVTVDSGNGSLSCGLANAYANAFVSARTRSVRDAARRKMKIIGTRLAAFGDPKAQTPAGSDYLAASYVELSQQFSDLEVTAARGDGGYRVLQPATVPTNPFSPKPFRSALLGFGVGLLAAVVLAYMLQALSTRLSSDDEAIALLGLRVMGRVPRERVGVGQRQTAGYSSSSEPPDDRREALRRLRVGLEWGAMGDGAKTLLFVSSSEGQGTSGTVANLAAGLARAENRVVVVDADVRAPTMHEYFHLGNEEGLTALLTGQATLEESLQSVAVSATGGDELAVDGAGEGSRLNLRVLTSGPASPETGELAGRAMKMLMERLKESADVVLVDSPGLLDAADASALASVVDGLIFIVDARVASRPALQQCKEYLDLMPCRQLGVVIMQESRRRSRKGRGRTKRARDVASEAVESAVPTVSVSPGG